MVATSNNIEILEFDDSNFYSSKLTASTFKNVKYSILSISEFIKANMHNADNSLDMQKHIIDFSNRDILISDNYGWSKLTRIDVFDYALPVIRVDLENHSSIKIYNNYKIPLYRMNNYNIGFHGLRNYDYKKYEINDHNINKGYVRAKRTETFDDSDFVKIISYELLEPEQVCIIHTKPSSYNVNGINLID